MCCLIYEHSKPHKHYKLINKTEYQAWKVLLWIRIRILLSANEVWHGLISPRICSEVLEFEPCVCSLFCITFLLGKFLELWSKEGERWAGLLFKWETFFPFSWFTNFLTGNKNAFSWSVCLLPPTDCVKMEQVSWLRLTSVIHRMGTTSSLISCLRGFKEIMYVKHLD